MIYSGFADEAGAALEIQIRATKELGWSYIEADSMKRLGDPQVFNQVILEDIALGTAAQPVTGLS